MLLLWSGCSGSALPAGAVVGGGAGGVGGGGVRPDAGSAGTGHRPPEPQIPFLGGPILVNPNLVTVTFKGYPYEQQVQAFGDWVVGSQWFAAVGRDYGVGPSAVHLQKVVIADPPALILARADVAQLLASRILDGTLPAPVPGLLYAVYFPSHVTLTLEGSSTSCLDFGGYHGEGATQQGVRFPFAAMPTCVGLEAAGDLATVEVAASHEIIEVASDPFPDTGPAYAISDATNPWHTEPEIGDPCTTLVLEDQGFTVQRIWSNSAAASGLQPCIPAPTGVPYFNTEAQGPIPLVAPGAASDFQLTGYATDSVPDWNLDASHTFGFDTGPQLGRTTLNDGFQTTLTLTVPSGTRSGSVGGVILLSTAPGADPGRWVVAVKAQ
jgi:hypothetical protein